MRNVVLTPFLLFAAAGFAAEPAPMAYPHGYRQWTHVKTVQIKSGHALYHLFGGIHHIYANKKAVEGYKRGKFANGSTLVLDLLEAREDLTSTSEGPRKLVAVMHKDAAKYRDTGGWGFEAFRADNRKDRMVGKNAAACFECHAAQKKNDYVFSSFRL